MNITLIENWMQQAWKLWSIRLAMLAGIVAGWATTYPQDFAKAVAMLPEPARPFVGLAVALLAAGSRLVRQPKLGGKPDGN